MHSISHVLEQRKYSKRTIESYVGWVGEFERFISPRDISSVSVDDVSRFFRHLSRNRSLSDQSVRLAASAINFLAREVLHNQNLLTAIPTIRLNRPTPDVPTQKEIFSLIGQVRKPTIRTALMCIYGMGLELQEALALRVRDLDFKAGMAQISTQRRRSTRRTPIPVCVVDELKNLTRQQPPDAPLFRSRNGTTYGDQALQRELVRARKLCGVEKQFTIRSFRHAYVLHLYMLGIPLKDVLDHAGMSNPSNLEFYSSLAGRPVEVSFSPADRTITNEDHALALESHPYVSEERITELSAKFQTWDTAKLVALLRELNAAYRSQSNMAIAMLTRAIIDHIPPILGFRTFSEVASNYSGGRSFKKAMEHLNTSLRNVADSHIHLPIRQKEDVPPFVQVDFRSDLDHLLGELIRVLHK